MTLPVSQHLLRAAVAALPFLLLPLPSVASEFSVSPVRVELKPGALSDTLTVVNHASERLRVQVRLMAWTQDEQGADVYSESGDIIYFPRQMEMDGEARRLIRIGAKTPGGATERTYRLFIEEQPEPSAQASRSAEVAVYFRFGVPVFVPPAVAKPQAEVGQPTLDKGKLSVQLRNTGNQHVRVLKLVVSDGAGFQKEIAGWYTLAGAQRTYTLDLPPEVCRKAKTLEVSVEGESLRVNRKLDVDPARCV